jgi:hypothetical protein
MSGKPYLKLMAAALLLALAWVVAAAAPVHAVPICGTPTIYQYSGGGRCIFTCSGGETCTGSLTGTITITRGHCMIC